MKPTGPDYHGGSLVNLMAEIEFRLTGSSAAPRLHDHLADALPAAPTYVVLVMDGLGDHQLAHPAAASLRASHSGTLDAPFPTTTTVSLASVATARPPTEHGLLGHLIWLPEIDMIVNSLKWIGKGGAPVSLDTSTFLATPNLWERCATAGVEAITVQPGHFATTQLTRALYRGCRFESIWSNDELARAVVELAEAKNRLIVAYLPEVDFAAHLFGQEGKEYDQALRSVTTVWESIAARLPADVVLIGTADHGHLDYSPHDKVLIDRSMSKGLMLFGDPRSLYARGSEEDLAAFADRIPATWYPRTAMTEWLGPTPVSEIDESVAVRMPDGVFLAEPGRLLIPGHMDRRLVGYHGGLAAEEREIPLLVTSAT